MPVAARKRCLSLVAIVGAFALAAEAQSFPLDSADIADSAALARSMPRLAAQLLPTYTDANKDTELDNRFRLELVMGRYADAARTLGELRALRRSSPHPTRELRAANVQYEAYVQAKLAERGGAQLFAQAFPPAFRALVGPLDDRTAALVARAASAAVAPLESDLRQSIAERGPKRTIAISDAVRLLRTYQITETYRALAPVVPRLADEDYGRRYAIVRNVLVRGLDGTPLCAMVVRPRHSPPRVPAILRFTIYADSATDLREAVRTASNGYASVTGYTRGKMCSPVAPVPFVHDADDATAVIKWIAEQPWSDGRVGMYSGSYEGFTQWAATKRLPKALKTIMTGAPAAPGIDAPMEGNIVWNFEYPWPFYATGNKTLDLVTYNDAARWRRLNHRWYATGGAYRDLYRIDGTPNPVFREWVSHESYDAYWRAMIPYREEFARIAIPVLQTAGYYFGGPGAALYYFTEHYKYRPTAEHYLVIGPYDHFQGQRGVVDALGDTSTILAGYEIDPAARIDIVADLRYQWFDYVFKRAPKPVLLRDRVNYQVPGANVWKHAPSIGAMSNRSLRFYLGTERATERSDTALRLVEQRPREDKSIPLIVDFRDRSDSDRVVPGGGVVDTIIDTANAIELVSDPIHEPTEIAGRFSGRLDFIANKKDFDLSIALFELTPAGKYVQIPPLQMRASYAADLARRQLLTPGRRTRIEYRSIRLASLRLEPGSRLVMVLGVIKNSGQQINYGSGKSVSEETIADAGEPLEIDWFTDSFVDVPIWRVH